MLLDTVRRLENLRADRVAVHIHLSSLTSSNKRNHYLRIATELFITCISAYEGQLFSLGNNDLVFLAKSAPVDTLDNAVNRLRVLFCEDPLAQQNDGNGDQPRFCTWYSLDRDYDTLLEAAQNLLQKAEEARQRPELDPHIDTTKLLEPIRPEILAKLEQVLERADVSNLIRRQTICTVVEEQKPQPLFEEIFVSIEDLQGITSPSANLLADRWLFQYLTQTLDRRVINLLIRDGVNTSRPFSLNLNVATVLSPLFARFEAIITPQLKGRLVIEMNKLDVFSDMGAFLFARDYLHDRGFRICLDGLTHHTLPYYDRERLGFDLIKIYWTPGSIDDMRQEMLPAIRNIVMEAGQARTILCRCDGPRAIEIGQSLGIIMFQGRYIEGLINPAFSSFQFSGRR
ncbi:MAG: EAL domain-containing protein [Alphaproteobacteria bacterium]|nr:EAL domain-containing protein [Alphaproteobacteria bacterium]